MDEKQRPPRYYSTIQRNAASGFDLLKCRQVQSIIGLVETSRTNELNYRLSFISYVPI